jgi:L-ribulose-5-phosphate 4-epimerase
MSDAAVERDYEVETGHQILECMRGKNPLHCPMALVAGHGPFAWGETAEKAVYNAAVLEELARMAFVTMTLDPSAPRLPDPVIKKHFERKHGKNAYYGQKR